MSVLTRFWRSIASGVAQRTIEPAPDAPEGTPVIIERTVTHFVEVAVMDEQSTGLTSTELDEAKAISTLYNIPLDGCILAAQQRKQLRTNAPAVTRDAELKAQAVRLGVDPEAYVRFYHGKKPATAEVVAMGTEPTNDVSA